MRNLRIWIMEKRKGHVRHMTSMHHNSVHCIRASESFIYLQICDQSDWWSRTQTFGCSGKVESVDYKKFEYTRNGGGVNLAEGR